MQKSRDWKSVFVIVKSIRAFSNGNGLSYERDDYNVHLRNSDGTPGNKLNTNRGYGYSSRLDAERGAAHYYRNQIKTMEKLLLGKDEK